MKRVSSIARKKERESDAQIIPSENNTSRNLPNPCRGSRATPTSPPTEPSPKAASQVGTSPLSAAAENAAPRSWIRQHGR